VSEDAGTPDRDGSADAELVTIADDWARAIVSNDADRIAAFIADDWVIVSDSGVTSAERFLALVRSGELTHSAMAATGLSRVRIYGDSALVTSRTTSTAHYGGRRSDAGEWTTDVFVKRAGRWLCALTQLTAAAPARALPTGTPRWWLPPLA
jgi:ketosteroid isomerase-like protein